MAEAEVEKLSKENTYDETEEIVIVDEWSDNDEEEKIVFNVQ